MIVFVFVVVFVVWLVTLPCRHGSLRCCLPQPGHHVVRLQRGDPEALHERAEAEGRPAELGVALFRGQLLHQRLQHRVGLGQGRGRAGVEGQGRVRVRGVGRGVWGRGEIRGE